RSRLAPHHRPAAGPAPADIPSGTGRAPRRPGPSRFRPGRTRTVPGAPRRTAHDHAPPGHRTGLRRSRDRSGGYDSEYRSPAGNGRGRIDGNRRFRSPVRGLGTRSVMSASQPHRSPLRPSELVDEYFIENRNRVIEIAAFLDRLDRSDPSIADSDFRVMA